MDTIGGTGTIESPDGVNIPKLAWVDKNRGQIKYLSKELGIPFPAVLISFPEVDYEMLGAGVRKGACVVRITSLFENFADSFVGSFDQETALKYFEFNDLVFEALEEFSGACFTKLIRIKETEDEDHDFLIITHTDYATELTELAAVKKVIMMTGNPSTIVNTPTPPTPTDLPGDFVL